MASSLHTHSYFSILDGYSSPEENLKRASELGLKALAVTEHGEVMSWPYYDKLRDKYPDVKILYGVELYECFDREVHDKNSKYFHLIAIAKNDAGRVALNKLVTLGHLHGFYSRPRVTLNDIAPYTNDLIICSACLASKLARTEDFEQCIQYIKEYKRLCPHFFLEIQAHSHEDQIAYNKKIKHLAELTDTKVVVTTDAHAARKEDLEYQSYLVRLAKNQDSVDEIYAGCYLMDEDKIHSVLDESLGHEFVEECVRNTDYVADLCDTVHQPFKEPELPVVSPPQSFSSTLDYFKSLIEQGWKERGFDGLPADRKEVYRKELEHEIDVIQKKGFIDYFLIIYEYINWAKQNNVIIGPGRGSAAGALVCYLLHITDLDPIKYDLDFSRFLTLDRKDLPDIDVDVSDRAAIVRHLTDIYGENKVAQVLNIVYITPLSAMLDAARLLGIPYAESQRISKGFTYPKWDDCVKANPKIAKNPAYKELLDVASHLTGRVRGLSIHAGGVICFRHDVNEYLAVRRGENGEHVFSADKHLCEELGAVKLDVLGVAALKMIHDITKMAGISEWEININNPVFEHDADIFRMICSGKTDGLFQIESAGMKDLITRMQPKSLEEVTAAVALYRPDAMPAIDAYLDCKAHPEHIKYIHPDMAQIFDKTYGQNIYQEQSMKITKVFGGRSDGGADRMRKVLAKKMPDKVKVEVETLHEEILSQGYSKQVADFLCNELKDKGGYGFNKSHAACYAYICMQTAYLKAHYPVEFFTALLNLNENKIGKINHYIMCAKDMGVAVHGPHVNKSGMHFTVVNGEILYGLSVLKSIGTNIAQQILDARVADGPFKNARDFRERVKLSERSYVLFIKAGAIPVKNKREAIIRYLKSQFEVREYKPVKSYGTKSKLLVDWGIDTSEYMVGNKVDKEAVLHEYNRLRKAKHDTQQQERYRAYIKECTEKYLTNETFWEFEALNVFITNNPFESAYEYLDDFNDVALGEQCTLVGITANAQKKKTKKGDTYYILGLYSGFGLIQCLCWPNVAHRYQDFMSTNQKIALLGRKENDNTVVVQKVKGYDRWLQDTEF